MMAKNITLMVEGDGDLDAVPLLFRRATTDLSLHDLVLAEKPIKTGDLAAALRSEKFLKLCGYAFSSRHNDGVFLCLDCDDQCPVEAVRALSARMDYLARLHCKPFAICLFAREFESMFLACIDQLSRGREEIDPSKLEGRQWEQCRGAKERFTKCISTGVAYKETRDQVRYANFVDLEEARMKYRPFAHFENVLRWFHEHGDPDRLAYGV